MHHPGVQPAVNDARMDFRWQQTHPWDQRSQWREPRLERSRLA